MQELIEKIEKLYLIKQNENSYKLFRQLELEAELKEKEQMFDLIKFMRTNDKMGKSVEDLYIEFINQ